MGCPFCQTNVVEAGSWKGDEYACGDCPHLVHMELDHKSGWLASGRLLDYPNREEFIKLDNNSAKGRRSKSGDWEATLFVKSPEFEPPDLTRFFEDEQSSQEEYEAECDKYLARLVELG